MTSYVVLHVFRRRGLRESSSFSFGNGFSDAPQDGALPHRYLRIDQGYDRTLLQPPNGHVPRDTFITCTEPAMTFFRISRSTPTQIGSPAIPLLLSMLLVVTSASILTSCTTAGSSASKNYDRKTISREQVEDYNSAADAYQIVRSLRPNWLSIRPSSLNTEGSNEVRVYVDGVRFGAAPNALRQIRVRNIEKLRYFDRREAATKFGTGHTQGVIMIYTRRG